MHFIFTSVFLFIGATVGFFVMQQLLRRGPW